MGRHITKRTVVLLVVLGAVTTVWAHQRRQRFFREPQIIERGDRAVGLLSSTYRIDKLYQSMTGPSSNHPGIYLAQGDPDQLVWVTGIATEVVNRDGSAKLSPEFFCHANLTLNDQHTSPDQHNQSFGGTTHLDWRLFTLVPGKLKIQLPHGFGVPMRAGEALDFFSMSLNQNVQGQRIDMRLRTRVQFVLDDQLTQPLRALFRRSVYGLVKTDRASVPDHLLGVETASHPGASCGLPGTAPTCDLGKSASDSGMFGPGYTIHWMVPPGKHTYRTEVTDQLKLPFDTTVHYATAHLHPFGESVELRDKTTGQTVFLIRSEDFQDRLGVVHMDEVTSQEGIPIDQSHRYELITKYNNTLTKPIDAMSIFYLYMLEKEFKDPI